MLGCKPNERLERIITMEKDTTQSLSLTKTKVAEIEGEHTITFVASSANIDRDYERLEIGTFRLPIKGGGEIRVADLPTGGATNIDIPLLTDHDLWSVDKVIGSVRKASFVNGELVFEAGISSIPRAQELFKLVEEGHLDNAFSIQYRDYKVNPETNVQTDGEIIEVSLVTRGANQDARVLAVKSMKGTDVEEEKPTPEVIEEKDDKELVEVAEEVASTEKAEETSAEPEAKAVEPEAEPEKPAEEEPAEAEETITINETKGIKMDKEVAKSLVKEPSQASVSVETNNGYLASKGAMKDFARIIASSNGNKVAIKSAWEGQLKAKGLAGTFTLPTELETIFFHAWNDVEADVLGTFRRSARRAGVANAFYGANAEDIRAKGHKKGETKAEQTLTATKRDLKGKIIYKKLGIDLLDLLEDEDGELLRFRTQELTDRLRTEVFTGAVLGDGRSEATPDYRVFDGSRGLYSMVADIQGSTVANSYASMVATQLNGSADDDLYAKIVKTLAKVKPLGITAGRDYRKVIVIEPTDLASLHLIQNASGAYLFAPGTDFEQVFNARIIELEGVKASGYDVIAYANQGYTLLGTDDMVRTDFDLSTNTDVMLVERLVAGSLEGNKVVAGYKNGVSA